MATTSRPSAMYTLIDTFDDFVQYWNASSLKTVEQQLELWEVSYMQEYPELLAKQVGDYEAAGYDWREVAREKVFPKLGEYLHIMRRARKNLIHVCGSTYEQAVRALELDFSVAFVIYVGIGCGAGWATSYKGCPACLLGLEKIAERGWVSRERLRELISHEIGHLVHMVWRDELEDFERHERNPLFLLYSEGFAKRCEYLILGKEGWNQADDENWILWCREHKGWLAKEYLHRVDSGKPVNDFFGDWLSIQGQRQTGYFLGWSFVLWLTEHHDIREIARFSFEEVNEETKRFLCDLAADCA